MGAHRALIFSQRVHGLAWQGRIRASVLSLRLVRRYIERADTRAVRVDKFRTTQGPADSRGPFLRPLDMVPWPPIDDARDPARGEYSLPK
jgi:hypothetical protein